MTDPTTDTTDPEDERSPVPFNIWLGQQRGGATLGELTDGLAELAAAAMDTGKGGTLTLQIKVGPASKAGGHQLLVSDAVVVKCPKAARSESIFYFDEHTGALTRNDPKQPQIPFTEVPRPATSDLKEAR